MHESSESKVIVIISATVEWNAITEIYPDAEKVVSPYGQWFSVDLDVSGDIMSVLFFQGGWGKISAAASTQYVIDRWSPLLLVNLGTCGGFEGKIEKGTIILVERTIVYDIIEQMLDAEDAVEYYTTEVDLSWLVPPYPQEVNRTFLVSGDRDLMVEDIPELTAKFGAVAGDWESGAIAWVAAHNNTKCLILRGVSDLVGGSGGEAYEGNIRIFEENARIILTRLVGSLPAWIARAC